MPKSVGAWIPVEGELGGFFEKKLELSEEIETQSLKK